jgi:hypothetical protein
MSPGRIATAGRVVGSSESHFTMNIRPRVIICLPKERSPPEVQVLLPPDLKFNYKFDLALDGSSSVRCGALVASLVWISGGTGLKLTKGPTEPNANPAGSSAKLSGITGADSYQMHAHHLDFGSRCSYCRLERHSHSWFCIITPSHLITCGRCHLKT